jgi:hypothetical protein
MEKSKTAYKVIIFMLVIYAIASLQFLVQEVKYLSSVGRKPYGERLDYLDKQYYKNYFYKYYDWINKLLPNDVLFSIYSNEKTDYNVYVRYAHKFDYYFYPRHVMFSGIEEDIARPPKHWPAKERLKYFKYSDAVFVLNTGDAGFKHDGKFKYVVLNGRRYYLVAAIDDKGLLLNRSLLRRKKGMDNIARAFRQLYGVGIDKAAF